MYSPQITSPAQFQSKHVSEVLEIELQLGSSGNVQTFQLTFKLNPY